MVESGVGAKEARVIGGGTKTEAIMQMLEDMFNINMKMVTTSDGGALGAIILAMVGDGLYSSVEEAGEALVHDKKVYKPNPEKHELYEKKFKKYK